MAKDYKHSPKPRDKSRRKGSSFPGWGSFIFGIMVAVVIIKGAPVFLKKIEQRIHPAAMETTMTPAETTHKAPTPSTAALTPHFDFYKLLPSFQVVIPSQDKEVRSGDVPGPVSQPGTYFLQVGSFQRYAEADKLKADLALLGVESSIQRVRVNDGSTWNRVRIGPIRNLKSLNAMRATLARNHIKPLVIRTD